MRRLWKRKPNRKKVHSFGSQASLKIPVEKRCRKMCISGIFGIILRGSDFHQKFPWPPFYIKNQLTYHDHPNNNHLETVWCCTCQLNSLFCKTMGKLSCRWKDSAQPMWVRGSEAAIRQPFQSTGGAGSVAAAWGSPGQGACRGRSKWLTAGLAPRIEKTILFGGGCTTFLCVLQLIFLVLGPLPSIYPMPALLTFLSKKKNSFENGFV